MNELNQLIMGAASRAMVSVWVLWGYFSWDIFWLERIGDWNGAERAALLIIFAVVWGVWFVILALFNGKRL